MILLYYWVCTLSSVLLPFVVVDWLWLNNVQLNIVRDFIPGMRYDEIYIFYFLYIFKKK